MRMIIKTGLLLVILTIATIGVVSADSHESGISGTWVGDPGGALMTHELTMPAGTDATITLDHWPCVTGDAITFEVWSTDGQVAHSSEATACSQSASFNTGAGGAATLKMFNHLTGVGSWYTLKAEGVEIAGAAEMAVEGDEAVEAEDDEAAETEEEDMDEDADEDADEDMDEDADEDADEDMDEDADEDADEDMDEDMDEDADEDMTEAAEPTEGMLADGATLLGNSGGAHAEYPVETVSGTAYNVTMTYGADQGGKWTGVGFRIYGPDGVVATGARPDKHNNDSFSASFTAGEGPYKIQVYNYHHGLTLFYSLEMLAAE